MGAIKDWAMGEIERLSSEGYSNEEIAKELDCDIEFVDTTLGVE